MRWFLTLVIALASGFAGAAVWDVTGLGDRATRAYLLANPEVLPEAMEVLQQREQQAAIEPLRGELETPFPGAVLGNPNGSVTLVEFHDAMFRLSPPGSDTIEAAAIEAGIDLERARAAIASGAFDIHLQSNAMLASRLGISGTPGWVVGDRALNGAVGRKVMGEAIEEARQS